MRIEIEEELKELAKEVFISIYLILMRILALNVESYCANVPG